MLAKVHGEYFKQGKSKWPATYEKMLNLSNQRNTN